MEGFTSVFDYHLQRLCVERFASRLRSRDASIWGADAEPEASIRLGWVDAAERADGTVAEALELRAELLERGVDRVLLCGMGGSSLGPEMIARSGDLPLTVLDSTHPDAVRRALAGDLRRTVVVVSSKSGSTVETLSQAAILEEAYLQAGLDPALHMVFVTDPGSALAERRERGFRVFLADPEVGGRFSVLIAFGLVPVVLAGADAPALLRQARDAGARLFADDAENPALRLAAALASTLPHRYVLAIDERSPQLAGLGDWVEQLVAESTGKDGLGVLPVALPSVAAELAGDPPANTRRLLLDSAPAADGIAAALSEREIAVAGPLGAQLLCWEVATAALGSLMGLNPFDQPDVEAAKIAAREALARVDGAEAAGVSIDPAELLESLRDALPGGGYLAIQAFVDPAGDSAASVRALRERLAVELGVPVALGWGPRYLHSTGQLHKGGPRLGVFLQVIDDGMRELPIPGGASGFAELISAQARGDREVLRDRGRPVFELAVSQLEAALAS